MRSKKSKKRMSPVDAVLPKQSWMGDEGEDGCVVGETEKVKRKRKNGAGGLCVF